MQSVYDIIFMLILFIEVDMFKEENISKVFQLLEPVVKELDSLTKSELTEDQYTKLSFLLASPFFMVKVVDPEAKLVDSIDELFYGVLLQLSEIASIPESLEGKTAEEVLALVQGAQNKLVDEIKKQENE